MPIENDTPTEEGALNVALHQRSATSPFAREVVNIQGDANAGRAIGFDATGKLSTLLVGGEDGGPVALADMAPLARGYVIGRKSSDVGVPEAVTVAEMIALSPDAAQAALGPVALNEMAGLVHGKIIGRVTSGTGTPEAVTIAQMIALDPKSAQTAIGGWTFASTESELRSAVAAGGHIIVIGTITLTSTLNITVAGTRLYAGFAAGQRAKLVFPSVANTAHDIVKIQASRVELHGLEITANNPLDPLTFNPVGTPGDTNGEILNPAVQRRDHGIRIDELFDTNDFVIRGCFIHHVTIGIYKTGSAGFPWLDRGRILDNCIQSFNWHGIYIDWCTRALLIERNWIWGRARGEQRTGGPVGAAETHLVPGNAIWVGDYVQRCTIRGNDCAYCDRHGIEVVNTPGNDANANDSVIIIANHIHNLTTPVGNPIIRFSMGISVNCGGAGCSIVDNVICDTTYFGIEIFNQGASQGNIVVKGNQIKDVVSPIDVRSAFGISCNSCSGALIVNNYIEHVAMTNNASTVETVGILVYGGQNMSHSGSPSFIGVIVSDNVLVDPGCEGIVLGSHPADERRCGSISNNVIRYTTVRQVRPTVTNECAVVTNDCGNSAVVKDNIFFYPAALPPVGPGSFLGGFDLLNTGSVHNGSATIVGAPGGRVNIGGLNVAIAY